jgi:hypothetical protein
MIDGKPSSEVRPRIDREPPNAAATWAQASDRGSGQPYELVSAVGTPSSCGETTDGQHSEAGIWGNSR